MPPPPPPNVVEYNKFMGSVDRSDQLRGYYRVRTKSRKCYHYIFWFPVDSCIVNAFMISKHYCPKTDSSRQVVINDFRQQLALGLIADYNTQQRYVLPASSRAVACHLTSPPAKQQRRTVSGEGHFPIKGPSSRCHWCWNYRKHRRHESTVHCRLCGKAFCLVPRDGTDRPSCFERFHTVVEASST